MLSFFRTESDNGAGVVDLRFQGLRQLRIPEGARQVEFLVKHHYEVVPEVFRYPSAVAGVVANDLAFARDDLHVGAPVEGIDDHEAAVAFRKGEAEGRGAVGGRDLRGNVVIGQVNAVVVRHDRFRLVREPALPLLLPKPGRSGCRHQGKLPVIVHPRGGLVGLLEAADAVCIVGVGPAVAHLAGLRGPEIHPPRTGNGGVNVSVAKPVFRVRSHERIGVGYGLRNAVQPFRLSDYRQG